MELVIFVGLQGSGKSTLFREGFAATHAHVSKDNFRHNRRPARRQRQLIEEAFAEGRSVVVDNTNLTIADRAELLDLGRAAGAELVCYYFLPDVEGSLIRNAGRVGKARVPDKVIRIAAHRLEPPTRAEGFDRLYQVRLAEQGGFEIAKIPSSASPTGKGVQ